MNALYSIPALSGLGKHSRETLSALLREGHGIITPSIAANILGISSQKANKILSNFYQNGWLHRVRNGVYIPIPIESATSDVVAESPWVIADYIFSPCYIGGWSAAEHWGLTEQIFNSVVICTPQKKHHKEEVISQTTFRIRTIPKDWLFGTKSVWINQVKIQVADPSRTIIDMLVFPCIGGGMRFIEEVFTQYCQSGHKDITRLMDYAARVGKGVLFKRLGFLLERVVPEEQESIRACRQSISSGYSKLDPALPADTLVTRWRLWVPDSWK
ncbi:MAG: type IV toxin-antitoxin system AbiEi family antitoxin [Candidatus Margulisiibacteriota bacterium]